MKRRSIGLAFLVSILFFLSSVPLSGDELVLNDVPTYYWYHGCSPTSGMMVLGYWDAHGYDNLIPGSNDWATNQIGIQNSIASSGHVSDYALYNGVDDYGWYPSYPPYADMSSINPSAAHANDCLADFMGTSRSSLSLYHGGSWPTQVVNPSSWFTNIASGLANYAAYRGHSFAVDHDGYLFTPSWDTYIQEIQLGRPIVLNVDSDGDGNGDHSVVAIGYRTTNGYAEYACWDTWSSTIRWEAFRGTSSSYAWGVHSMEKVRPDMTWDTVWKGGSGSWDSSSLWDNGVPDVLAFTYIPAGSSATVTNHSYVKMLTNAGDLHLQEALVGDDFRNYKGRIYLESDSATLGAMNMVINDQGQISGHGMVFGQFTNSGTLVATGGTLAVIDPITGGGTVTVDPGATLKVMSGGTISGAVQNAGNLWVRYDTLTLAGGISGSGSLSVDPGATVSLPAGGAIAGGTIQGTLLMDGGTLTLTTGTLVLTGNNSLNPGGYYYGGGIYVQGGGTLEIAGGLTSNWGGSLNKEYGVMNVGTGTSGYNTLKVDGGRLQVGKVYVGADSVGYNVVEVTTPGNSDTPSLSTGRNSGTYAIGINSSYNSMTISNGAYVSTIRSAAS